MTPDIRRLLPSLLACHLALLPGAAEAQNDAQRAALAEWEAQVERVTDPDELRSLLRAPADTSGRDKTSRLLAILRRGFTRYRLGTLTEDRRYYDQALEDFWSVLQEKYRWPHAWYGLGLTKAAMSRQRLIPYEAAHQPPGSTYAEEAIEALRRALEHDENFAAASAALALAEQGDPGTPALRDSAVVLLDQARGLLAGGERLAGLEAYGAASARASSNELRARLRADLAWIADSAELHDFDATSAEALPAWLDAFWERRDVRDARRPGERLAEHYRRLAHAERHFTRLGSNVANAHLERLARKDRTLDDRAVIYVRHGEPSRRASFGAPFASVEHSAPQEQLIPPESPHPTPRPPDGLAPVPPNLSWKYERPEGDLIFHFVAHQGSDYRLMESLLDVYSVDTVIQLQMGRSQMAGDVSGPQWEWARFARSLVSSRADFDPLYARLANGMTIQGSGNLQRERAAGQHSLEVGTTTDSHRERFDNALDPVIQAYGLGSDGDGRVLVVIGVPAGRLPDSVLGVRAVISTPRDQRLVQVDTVLDLVPSLDADFQGAVLDLAVPPGTHRVRVVAADEARQAGGAATIDAVVVPARPGPPALSDLVIGERHGLSWHAADGVVRLDADGVLTAGSTAELYYQVSDLTPGTTYRTRIELRRARDRQRIRRITSAFDMVATDSTQAERRELSLAGLRTGDYVLELTLAGPSGTVTRSRPLRVR